MAKKKRPKGVPPEAGKDKKEEEIRKLKEKIKKLEAAKSKGKEEEAEGIVEGILEGVGGIIPGLEGLLKGVMKSPAFKEKLGQIEKEIEYKIKQAPLKRTEGRGFGIPPGIPPGVRGRVAKRKRFVKEKPAVEKPKAPPPKPKERPADVFDEKDYIKVIAEIPGVDEKDIKINLEKDKLNISCDIPDHRYKKELILPCIPKGELSKTYKNGILEVVIKKV